MISSSSFSSRTNLKMLKPLQRATRPRMTNTNTAQVPQKVTISSARFDSAPPPNCATVYAMPPNAPSGAAHMIMRMTANRIFEMTSNTASTCSRWRRASTEMPAATRIAMISTRRISLSTNGCTNEVGSRSSVMNPVRPVPAPAASAIFSFAASVPEAVAAASKPDPGLIRLPASRPSPSASTVAIRK
jgi:hypothetical protein